MLFDTLTSMSFKQVINSQLYADKRSIKANFNLMDISVLTYSVGFMIDVSCLYRQINALFYFVSVFMLCCRPVYLS